MKPIHIIFILIILGCDIKLLVNSNKQHSISINKYNNNHRINKDSEDNRNCKLFKVSKLINTISSNSDNEILVASNTKNTIIDSKNIDPYYRKLRYSILSLLLPWFYFMSVSINIPSYPKLINYVINKGDTNVSGLSSKVFGNISGIDAFFTFLSVNLIGCLSDRYGRKIFMFISSFGLGFAYLLASYATQPKHFYISACIDGITSCMLSQSQAYITDFSTIGSNLSIELSKFQGLAVGCAFMVGIPIGAILQSKYSIHTPIYAAISLCVLNCMLIPLLPITMEQQREQQQSSRAKIKTTQCRTNEVKHKSINWKEANPFGAVVKLTSTKKLFIGSLAYFLINLAQAGLQSAWINYLQHRFGWSAQLGGSTLTIVGFIVATIPPMIIPYIGIVNAFKYGLLLHALSLIYLGTVTSTPAVFMGMPFLAAGASAMPILLGYLTEQVPRSEVGALQGAADTVRTISVMIGSPLVSRIFSYFISNERNFPSVALYVSAMFSLIGYALVANF